MTGLLQPQAALQAEADALLRDLQLEDMLRPLGRPVRVGSSAMGPMVRRDIDITVVCRTLDEHALGQLADLAARLMQCTASVESVRFRNDAGQWNKEPEKYPDGFYLGLTVRAGTGEPWTLDIWLVGQPARQPDLRHLESLLPRIGDDHRRAILEIKHALAGRPASTDAIPSILVYEAVVDHHIRTIAAFDRWHADRLAR
ncbi:hypothetical protein [Pleomorphomonas koreensis]|uniref:hypothetical protein n=1 Tax=Pleomorphomonas koreensis TaxID=257440 RepID=UPI000401804E|nr:hypothetical protein [Pleomorphomonas koreensis]